MFAQSARRYLLAPAAFVALLALTNRYPPWSAGIARAGDIYSYEQMAIAAPGLPQTDIGSAYSQRFAVHYAVGLLADTGLGLHAAYWLLAVAMIGVITIVMARIFQLLGLSAHGSALCLALLFLNPYSTRPYLSTPGAVQDVVFVACLTLILYAVITRRLVLAMTAIVTAVAARQTALVVAPALGLWVLLDARFAGGADGGRWARRVAAATGVITVTVCTWLAIRVAVSSFTRPFEPSIPADTIFPDLRSFPQRGGMLIGHVLRVMLPLLPAFAALAAALVALRRREGRVALPPEFPACLLLVAAIVVQPLVISPRFPGLAHNEQRLSVMALAPLVTCLAIALRRLEERAPGPTPPAVVVLVLAALLAASFQRDTSVIPLTPLTLGLLQVLAAVVVAAMLLWTYVSLRGRGEPAEAASSP